MNSATHIFIISRIHPLPFIVVLTALLGISTICSAQIELSDFNDFKHFTEEDGLASTYISDIQEDKYGFLWIATGHGVSRYDGNHFTNFTYYYEDSTVHEIGYVGSLVIDQTGENIWIGSKSGILFTSVDAVNFQRIDKVIPSQNISISRSADLFLDNPNLLWASNLSKGLLRINLKENKQVNIVFVNDSQKDNSELNSLQCFVNDPYDSAILWIGTLAGLIRFNCITNEYQTYVYHNDPEMAQNRIRKIEVSDEEVFLGTWSEGLVIFNKRSEQFRNLTTGSNKTSHLLILDLYKENDTTLWITTSNELIQYDTYAQTVTNEINHNEATGILRGVSFVDSRDIIWYCSRKGLFKFDPQQSQNLFIELEKRTGVQSPFLIRKIIFSKDHYYVLGQVSSGLFQIDARDYSFEVIDYPYLKKGKGPNTTFRDMAKMIDGNFLIISDEITIFNPQTRQIKLSPIQIDHPHPSFQNVIKDHNDNYWIGTRAAGLFRLNFNNNSIKNYKEEFNVYGEGNYIWINRLFIDSENILWIGKGSSSVLNLNDSSVICLDEEEKNSVISYQDVFEFHEDNKGRVWMAGGSDGLGFTSFENFKNGVSHQVDGYFSGVYAYNDSLLWTTGRNLGIFNLNTRVHQEVKLSANNDNLRVSGPILRGRNGDFIVGCNNGVLIYNPEKQIINQEVPVPYIRVIVSDGKTLYEGNNLTIRDFRFKSGTKHIVIHISSLGFHFSDQISYQFKFEGDWQNIGIGNEITLTNLSSGDYKLRLRACNNLGISNEFPNEYNIIIPAPWWATWWAYFIYMGIAVLFADRFYRFQLSKRLAVAESVKFKEINKLKNSLYTNITHEFRTPLTVILGMVDAATTNIRDKQLKGTAHALEMIKRNGENLLRLVNEMLDLSKLESGNMQLQLIQSDIIPFIKYLSDGFYSLAHDKQIKLTVYSETDELLMDFDANKLSAIVSNVLSNAIKFTQPGGKIIVHLNRIYKNKPAGRTGGKEFFFMKIKDNGRGISENELHHIFNRFYQVDNSSSRRGEGTGVGLALTKEFVELMNGTIEVSSSLGKGSEFTIRLPIRNSAPQTNDFQILLEPNLAVSSDEEELIQPISDDKSELPLALIIEDNVDVSHYLKTCLTGKYQTIHSVNGEIGIETAFEKVPDIIICDVMMPVKDGFEVCSTLKTDERTDHIPIILLTAKVTMKDKLAGLSYGADAYLTKPFVKAELLTRLDQLVLLRKKIMQKIDDDSLSKLLKKRAEDPETKFLQKTIKIIHEEISNHSFGSSLQLSNKMHLSESQIYRKLKAITGKSTAVFIRSVRLQKAKEMIQTTDKTISEIAYDVGFNDPSWFSRAFKEEFGFAPSAISK